MKYPIVHRIIKRPSNSMKYLNKRKISSGQKEWREISAEKIQELSLIPLNKMSKPKCRIISQMR